VTTRYQLSVLAALAYCEHVAGADEPVTAADITERLVAAPTVRSVQRILAKLEVRGLCESTREPVQHGRLYRVTLAGYDALRIDGD
jgi:DNA-binding IscR family transcriptional regulator